MSVAFDGYQEQNRPESRSRGRLSRASGIDGYRPASNSTVRDNCQRLVLGIPGSSYGNPQPSTPLEIEMYRRVPRGIDRYGRGAPAKGRETDTRQGPSV